MATVCQVKQEMDRIVQFTLRATPARILLNSGFYLHDDRFELGEIVKYKPLTLKSNGHEKFSGEGPTSSLECLGVRKEVV